MDEESPFCYSVYCSNFFLELKLSSDEQTSQSVATKSLEILSTEKKRQFKEVFPYLSEY